MEHPLRVDEFRPSDAPPTAAAEDEIAPPLAEATATPSPPLPNLPESEVQFLRRRISTMRISCQQRASASNWPRSCVRSARPSMPSP
jgi:hypothetical protein